MPTAVVKSFARKAGVSVEHAEEVWASAKRKIKHKGDDSRYWAEVSWLTQKMLGLKESLSLKEFSEIDLTMPMGADVNPTPSYTDLTSSETPHEEALPLPDPDIMLTSQISTFVSCLFGARDQAHVFHLNTKSFAKHKALEELYELLVDHADKWAEVGQGMTGFPIGWCLGDTQRYAAAGEDACCFVKLLADDLCTHATSFTCPVLSNMMQELQAGVYRIKYKLERLN